MGGVEFYLFKSFENTEEQENRRDLTLSSGQKNLKVKDVGDAVAAMKEPGWTVPGFKREALRKIIGQMEVSEVGMHTVYKDCLYVVIEHGDNTHDLNAFQTHIEYVYA